MRLFYKNEVGNYKMLTSRNKSEEMPRHLQYWEQYITEDNIVVENGGKLEMDLAKGDKEPDKYGVYDTAVGDGNWYMEDIFRFTDFVVENEALFVKIEEDYQKSKETTRPRRQTKK